MMAQLPWYLMKQNFRKIAITILVVLGIVWLGFNYWDSKNYRAEIAKQVGETNIEILEMPEMLSVGEDGEVVWKITTPTEREISKTAIYFDEVATPSAVTTKDAPEALGYRKVSNDYIKGEFFVPAEFETKIKATKEGKMYLRGYAKIDGDNYWTEEKQIMINE